MRQLSRKEKEAAILSAVVVLGIGSFCYLQADSMEVAEPAVPTKTAAVPVQPKAESLPVVQRQEAAQQGELCNPFSWTHETRDEAAAMPSGAEELPIEKAEPVITAENLAEQTQPKEADTAAEAKAAIPEPTERPILCGIVSGGGRKLALLQLGAQTRSLAAGEWLGDYEVRAIFADCVCLQTAAGEIWLRLGNL